MNRIDGKVALITGCGSGIGEAISILFAKAGATVIGTDMNYASALSTVKLIQEAGYKAIAMDHNVSSEEDWERVMTDIDRDYKQLDILVNNAGIGIPSECKDTSLKDWNQVIGVNLSGAFIGIRGTINMMLKNNNAVSIINISSGYGIVGGGFASYSASKGGLAVLTKSVAVEAGKLGYKMRINSVHPGAIDTPMSRQAAEDNDYKKAHKDYAKLIPMGRFGKPIEVAKGVLFLASDDSSYITGSNIVIDGGYTAA